MPYLLLASDPVEGTWTILLQSDTPDEALDEFQADDPSHRIIVNTDNFITFDTKPVLKTPEEKRAFSDEWDRRYEEGQQGV